MLRQPNPNTAGASPPPPETATATVDDYEFRSFEDDAWYSARFRFLPSSHRLKLTYCNLADACDRFFHASEFRSLDDVHGFRSRFRVASPQLQDFECHSVTRGTLVCASYSPIDDCICFYDAVVNSVDRKIHSTDNCTCSFMIIWKHGPNKGKLERKSIESICLVHPSTQIDPNVVSFLAAAREQIKGITAKPSARSGRDVSICSSRSSTGKNNGLDVQRFSTQAHTHADNSAEGSITMVDREEIEEVDLGGVGKCFMIFIENLEKDLRASCIEDLIQSHISVSTRACVFPCFPMESYARGVVFVDSETSLKKLWEFLEDTDQIIISNRGRPLIVTGKVSGHAVTSCSAIVPKYIGNPASLRLELRKEVLVVRSGTAEYRKAKELKEMLSHFLVKQRELHNRLDKLVEGVLKQPAA